MITSLYELDGTPNDLDPRHVLRRVVERFAADGLTPVVACELEYYLVDRQRTAAGGIELAGRGTAGERPTLHGVYGLRELEDFGGFLRELWSVADAQGVPLEGGDLRIRPGQLELTLRHGPDALRAADEAVMYKRIAKGVAVRHGAARRPSWPSRSPSGPAAASTCTSASTTRGATTSSPASDPAGAPALRHAVGGLKALLGRGHGHLRAQRQLLPPLPRQLLRPGGADLGGQQPHRLAARAGRAAGRAPHRAPRGRRRRQSLPRAGRAAGRRPPWPDREDRSRAAGGRATATPRAAAGARLPATGSRPSTISPARPCCATIWARGSSRCSPPSSGPSRTASSRSSRRSTTTGA